MAHRARVYGSFEAYPHSRTLPRFCFVKIGWVHAIRPNGFEHARAVCSDYRDVSIIFKAPIAAMDRVGRVGLKSIFGFPEVRGKVLTLGGFH